ncbi:AAA family ATPase [Trebonia kvetii]|uniref:AAA family ATPase n=1 Tax=Trebonia kvetii TaxID=2480626 RepID=A0A6P2BUB3_9ACTN|nr:AAA family ATPase [Trebonia kvetii]TVZ01685.1 AAA family ATPase [Trebonia kvetii]
MKKSKQPAELGLTYEGGRPREEDILTRRRIPLWDRIKWLVLLAVIWFLLVWSLMADNQIMGFQDALRIEVQLGWWVFILAGLEVVHQAHFLISEHSARYNQFWIHKVWGRSERFQERKLSAWTRYRIGRVIRWVILIAVLAILAGKIMHEAPLTALVLVPSILWHALPTFIQYAFLLFFTVAQFALLFWFMSRGGVDVYYPDDIKTRFSDVWGQDHVLERVKENIVFLQNPELIEDRGGYVPGGILLWGPPGTGKTLMAEAVAGETGRPYVFVDPGAFINMFMGVGILKVKSLFRKLRKLSLRYGGVIVFFDEADSLGNRGIAMGGQPGGGNVGAAPFANAGCHGFSYLSSDSQWRITRDMLSSQFAVDPAEPRARRNKQIIGAGMNGGGGGGGMGTLQALLTELSGLKKPRGFINRVVRRALGMKPKPPPHYRILVMMATNMPSTLDEALLRPGRIDRMYRVGYPSKAGRIRTYEGYFAKVSHELTAEQIDKLATITPYATGASIKDMVNEALIIAIRDGRDVITYQDVIKAKQLKELGPPEDVEYIERERHAVAIHEACHAVVAYRTRHHMEIDIATIEKGSDYLGMVSSIKPEDQFTRWRSEYESDILVALASLAGERMFFDSDSSSGVSGDLDSATTVASFMEGYWGMGKTVTSAASARRLEAGTPGGPRSAAAPGKGGDAGPSPFGRLADRIEDNLGLLLVKVEEILRENERYVLALAHALESHKTLSGEDVTAVFEGGRGPLVDGAPYADDAFIAKLRDYHLAAKLAHQQHNQPQLTLPVAEPVFAIADSYGSGGFLGGSAYGPNGNGSGTGTSGSEDVIDFGGIGTGNGSHGGPLGAPTYDPPAYGEPDDSGNDET